MSVVSSRCLAFALSTRWVDEVGYADAEHVEDKHRCGEEAHADGVRQGADDGGDEEDCQDGIPNVSDEELCVDDAEEREEEDEDWELKGDAQAEYDREEELGVVINSDDGVEAFAEVKDEDFESTREDPVISEPGTGQEEADGGSHEREDVASLVGVHARRDEEPKLVEDEGRGEDCSTEKSGLEIEVESVGGMGEVEGDVEVVEGFLDDVVEPLVEGVGDGEACEEIEDGVDDAFAKLGEMLHEGHAGEFCAIGDGGAHPIQGVEFSH